MLRTAPRRRRRRGWGLGILSGILILYVAMSVSVFTTPSDPYDVHQIDAVFILGPPTQERIAAGERIAREAGGVPVYLSVWAGVGCDPRFVCVHADPWTTAGEAEALAEAVREDGVRHPLVVTGGEHVMRARYIFDRCVPMAAPVIGIDDHLNPVDWLWQPIYQWGAMVKAFFGGCADGRPTITRSA
ncbi:MAG: hypothetical protein JSS74_03515 [Actinobacteria bacterium]|nr:hypothetical protein [Actinomycetota bacterium]